MLGPHVDEVRDRHLAVGRAQPQLRQFVERAFFFRQANDDVDFVFGIVRPVLADLDAIGDELHHGTDSRNAGIVAACFLAIDGDFPFDAGQGTAVLDILQVLLAVEEGANPADLLGQQVIIVRCQLQANVLAGGWPALKLADFHLDAANIGGALADFLEDFRRLAPFGVVGEFDLHDDQNVGRHVLRCGKIDPAAATATAGGGCRQHDVVDAGNLQHFTLDLDTDVADVLAGKIAPRLNENRGDVRFLVDEELDAFRVGAEADEGAHCKRDYRGDDHEIAPQGARQVVKRAHIDAHRAAQLAWVELGLGGQHLASGCRAIVALAAKQPVHALAEMGEDTARCRHENQCRQQRGGQNDDHHHRQIAHEFARNPGPQQQRQEGCERRCRGGDDRPEHQLGGPVVGLVRRQALGHLAVGILDHHDGAIDQHADGQHEAEHHHHVHRHAEEGKDEKADHEGGGNGKTHQQAGSEPQRADDHDHHQRNRSQDRGLQRTQNLIDEARLVDHVVDLDRLRPVLREFPHHIANVGIVVDDVGADALDDLERHGRLAVDAGIGRGILEVAADIGDLAERHHALAVLLDRDRIDVLRRFDQARKLDVEACRPVVDEAGGNELVVLRQRVEQFLLGDVVGFELQEVEHHFKLLDARTLELCFANRGNRLDLVLKLTGEIVQRTLGNIARKGNDDRRLQGEIGLEDRRFVGFLGQVCLGQVHLVADIGQHLVLVGADLEFEHDAGMAFGGNAGDLLQPVKASKLGLHRLDQQSLRIFRRNAALADRHIVDRNIDVGIGFLGDRDVGEDARDHHDDHHGDNGLRPRKNGFERSGHCAVPDFCNAPAAAS